MDSDRSRLLRWGTTATSRRARTGSTPTSTPLTQAVPPVRRTRVVRIPTVVVFPAPFGPSSPSTSPRRTAKLTPSTAFTFALRYRLIRSRTSTTGPCPFPSTPTSISVTASLAPARQHAQACYNDAHGSHPGEGRASGVARGATPAGDRGGDELGRLRARPDRRDLGCPAAGVVRTARDQGAGQTSAPARRRRRSTPPGRGEAQLAAALGLEEAGTGRRGRRDRSSLTLRPLRAGGQSERAPAVAQAVGATDMVAPDVVNPEVLSICGAWSGPGSLPAREGRPGRRRPPYAPVRRFSTLPLLAEAWMLRANVPPPTPAMSSWPGSSMPLVTADRKLSRVRGWACR